MARPTAEGTADAPPSQEALIHATRTRVTHAEAHESPERIRVRQWLEYQNTRCVTGTIVLRNRAANREAQLLQLDDGECILLLVMNQTLYYWTPSSEPIHRLHRRACHWLTEPTEIPK